MLRFAKPINQINVDNNRLNCARYSDRNLWLRFVQNILASSLSTQSNWSGCISRFELTMRQLFANQAVKICNIFSVAVVLFCFHSIVHFICFVTVSTVRTTCCYTHWSAHNGSTLCPFSKRHIIFPFPTTGHCIDVITISIDYDIEAKLKLNLNVRCTCLHSPFIEIKL